MPEYNAPMPQVTEGGIIPEGLSFYHSGGNRTPMAFAYYRPKDAKGFFRAAWVDGQLTVEWAEWVE